MSRLYVAPTVTALTLATAKIPQQWAPTATSDAQLVALDVTFDTVFSATLPLIEVCTYGTVGSGGSVITPAGPIGENRGIAATTVVRANDTTAPLTITVLWSWYWSAGYLWPLGREVGWAPSGKYCIRVTSPASGNCAINAWFTE